MQQLLWILLLVAFLVGMAAYVVVAQTDRSAASIAEEIKQEVVNHRIELE